MLRMLIGQGVLVVSTRHTYKFPQKNPSPGCIRKDIHPGSAEHLVIKQHKKTGMKLHLWTGWMELLTTENQQNVPWKTQWLEDEMSFNFWMAPV